MIKNFFKNINTAFALFALAGLVSAVILKLIFSESDDSFYPTLGVFMALLFGFHYLCYKAIDDNKYKDLGGGRRMSDGAGVDAVYYWGFTFTLVILITTFVSLSNQPVAIQKLRFDNNLLSGSISNDRMQLLQQVQVGNFSFNFLTGTIPQTISTLKTLTIFDVRSNNMGGTIGTVFHTLPKLLAINLQNNYFEGNLDNVFNVATQLSLNTIDFSDNQLTGDIPEALLDYINGIKPLIWIVTDNGIGSLKYKVLVTDFDFSEHFNK
jgi:hypothetical protein